MPGDDHERTTFAYELEGWAGRVVRLRREAEESADSSDFWGPYDLAGACHNRDRVEARNEGRSRTLEAVDELYRTFTEDVGAAWVDVIGIGEEKSDHWWWQRVPKRGPLRDELTQRGFTARHP